MGDPLEHSNCQFYLVVTVGPDGQALERLQPVLAHANPASILITPAEGYTLEAQATLPLLQAGQGRGSAVLIANDAQLARTIKADGVHLDWSDDINQRYEEAREILGQRFIVGVDAGRSRHHAMSLGEAGADYVGFGIPSFVEDRSKARERQEELIAWWAEIFEIPAVAFDVEDHEAAAQLATAGADFVARHLPSGLSPADLQNWAVQCEAATAMAPLSE